MPDPELTQISTTDDLQLTALRRVDWTKEPYLGETDFPRRSLPLPRFIWKLPSLEVPCINGTAFPNLPSGLSLLKVHTIHLPQLRTLRLSSLNAVGTDVHWPALRRLVVNLQGVCFPAHADCLATQRFNVTVLELGCDPKFLGPGSLHSLLRFYCNVEEVRIPVCTTAVDEQTDAMGEFPSIRRVVYSAAMSGPEADFENQRRQLRQVEGHLEQLAVPGRRFVNVESITLVGEEWLPIVCEDRFKVLVKAIEKRGIQVIKNFAGRYPVPD